MDNYVTGDTIRHLREKRSMTQLQLAEALCVSPKTISKWETKRGLPDITLIEPLAAALGVSVQELMSGKPNVNENRAGNVLRSRFYVCPVCGNVLYGLGAVTVSCCGVTLPPLEAEAPDEGHSLTVQQVEDEWYVSAEHEMSKQHYISFFAHVTTERISLVKCYPESRAECRFPMRGKGILYVYCNRHGLMKQRL